MYTIDLTRSIASLFNKDTQAKNPSEPPMFLLSKEEKSEWDYYIKLLKEAKWERYKSNYSGYLLQCIKRNTNESGKDNVAHRLFFLVDNQKNIILLTNKRVTGNEHSSLQHFQTVEQCVNRLENKFSLHIQDSTKDVSYAQLDGHGMTQTNPMSEVFSDSKERAVTSFERSDSKDVEKALNAVMEGKLSRAKLTCIIKDIIERQEWPKDHIAAIKEFVKSPKFHFHFQASKNRLEIVTKCKNGSAYTTVLPGKLNSAEFIKQFIANIQNDDLDLHDILCCSISCDPQRILNILGQNTFVNFDVVNRAAFNHAFDSILDSFDNGVMTYTDFENILCANSRHGLLKLLNNDNLRSLSYEILKILAAIRFSDRPIEDSRQISRIKIDLAIEQSWIEQPQPLSALNHNNNSTSSTSTTNTSAAVTSSTSSEKSRRHQMWRIFEELLPSLPFSQLKIIFRDEFDIIDHQHLESVFSLVTGLSFLEHFDLALLWLSSHKTLDVSIINRTLKPFYETYAAASDAQRAIFSRKLLRHKGLLKTSIFEDVFKKQEAEQQRLPAIHQEIKHTSNKKPPSRKTKMADFKKFYGKYKNAKNIVPKIFLKDLAQLLESHLRGSDLCFRDAELAKYFIEYFLQKLSIKPGHNLISKLARFGDTKWLRIVCEFCLQTDKKLLHQNNQDALHEACMQVDVEVMRLLVLQYDYDANLKNARFMPLQLVLMHKKALKTTEETVQEALKVLIAGGADANREVEDGIYPLHFAVANLYNDVTARILLELGGANPNKLILFANGESANAFDFALGRVNGDDSVCELLTSFGAFSSRGPTIYWNNGVRDALQSNKGKPLKPHKKAKKMTKKIKAILLSETSLDVRSILKDIEEGNLPINTHISGYTLLHKLIEFDYYDTVETILNRYQPILNSRVSLKGSKSQDTFLHFCINSHRGHFTEMLLEHGAPMTLFNARGELPLHTAIYYGDLPSVDALLEAGADPLSPLQNGQPMLKFCRSCENEEMFYYLLSKKQQKPYSGLYEFQLRQAALYGNVDRFKNLRASNLHHEIDEDFESYLPLPKKSDENIYKDTHKKTVLQIAYSLRHEVQKPYNQSSIDSQRNTPLYLACLLRSADSIDMIDYLLTLPYIDVTARNTNIDTPLNGFLLHQKTVSVTKPQQKALSEVEVKLKTATCKRRIAQQDNGNKKCAVYITPTGDLRFFKSKKELDRYANKQPNADKHRVLVKGRNVLKNN